MSQHHPGSDLSFKQLVHALTRALDPNSSSRRTFFELEPQRIFHNERDFHQTLQVVRAIRNTHVPINKLPPEVLPRILNHRSCGQDLIVATHVCQYWRSVLISAPSLWTTFHFRFDSDVDRTLIYLGRSKALPIDIKITTRYLSRGLDALLHFSPHISRTRSLVLEAHSGASTASSHLLCKAVPSLERLYMRSRGGLMRPLDNFLGRHAPSLHSATFIDICPMLKSPFPLPNLNYLDLTLPLGMGPLRTSLLLGLYSSCPQLRSARMNICCKMLEDVALGQIVLMDSLVELEYGCDIVDRFLPCLNLPRLNRLCVTLRTGKVDKLAPLLPHNGLTLLSGATSMSHSYPGVSQVVKLSGKGVKASFTLFDKSAGAAWFSDEAYIPFGQIQDLEFSGLYVSADFPIHLFKHLPTLRVNMWDEATAAQVLGLLRPLPGTGIPCPSLRDIDYIFPLYTESLVRFFINLAGEREQAGYKLKSVYVLSRRRLNPSLEEELKEHVGELQVDVREKD